MSGWLSWPPVLPVDGMHRLHFPAAREERNLRKAAMRGNLRKAAMSDRACRRRGVASGSYAPPVKSRAG
jgi:hypothetical protein